MKGIHKKRIDPAVISYMNMRRWIGWLALALPVLTAGVYLIIGAHRWIVLDSISEYYYTMTRDVFVGTLAMVALFLISYKGYDDCEDWVFNVAAVLAILVALFSMNPEDGHTGDVFSDMTGICTCDIHMDSICAPSFKVMFQNKTTLLHYSFYRYIHFACAGILFIILGYVSLFFFTKNFKDRIKETNDEPSKRKKNRNGIYIACGIIIWVSLGLYCIYCLLDHYHPELAICKQLTDDSILFYVEWICLWAFGFSWLVKGEGVWFMNDSDEDKKRAHERELRHSKETLDL